jgi:hypothetical protein
MCIFPTVKIPLSNKTGNNNHQSIGVTLAFLVSPSGLFWLGEKNQGIITQTLDNPTQFTHCSVLAWHSPGHFALHADLSQDVTEGLVTYYNEEKHQRESLNCGLFVRNLLIPERCRSQLNLYIQEVVRPPSLLVMPLVG